MNLVVVAGQHRGDARAGAAALMFVQ